MLLASAPVVHEGFDGRVGVSELGGTTVNSLRAKLLPLLLFLAAACGGGDAPPPVPVAFAPTSAVLPFPTDFVFVGTLDGTLNIPVTDPDDISNPVNALNALDGFSTISPIAISVKDNTAENREVDGSTVIPGVTVRVFEMIFDPDLGAPVAVAGEVSTNDYTAVASGRSIVVIPLRPLKPKTSYLVLLTTGMWTSDGLRVGRSRDYNVALTTSSIIDAQGRSLVDGVSNTDAQIIEQFRPLTILHAQFAADAAGIAIKDLVLTSTFRTQSIGDVLSQVRTQAQAETLAVQSAGIDTGDLGFGLPGIADIYVGTLDVPYYLDKTNPLGNWWKGVGGSEVTQFNRSPVATETLAIPVMMTVPNAGSGHTKPDDGWPIIIYQHGITRVRTDMVAVADAFAAAGFVTIAIDMPLHGVTDDTGDPFYQPTRERTFDLDLIDNSTGAPGSDGIIDPSGTHIINLSSLLTSRDNLRQATADLFTLVKSLDEVDFDDEEGGDLDPENLHIFAHSLGAMIAIPFLAIEDTIDSAVMAYGGGGIMRLFEASESFGPLLIGGLAAAGIFQGTPEFDQFMTAAQTVVDSADCVNYIEAAAQSQPLYMMELVGKAPNNPPDLTVPNFVLTAPLSGTEPLAALAQLLPVTGDLADGNGLRAIVRYTALGTHSAYLEPANNVTIAPEIVLSATTFFATAGTVIDVVDPTTIE